MTGSSTGADRRALSRLVGAKTPCVAICTVEEEYVLEFVTEVGLAAGGSVTTWSVTRGLRDGRFAGGGTPVAETDHPAAALYHIVHMSETQRHAITGDSAPPPLHVFLDLASHLDDARTLRLLRELIARCRSEGGSVILVDHARVLPEVIEAESVRLEGVLPDEDELDAIVRRTIRAVHVEKPVTVELRRSELRTIVRNLRGLSRGQAARVVRECVADDRRLDAHDIDRLMTLKQAAVAASFGGSVLEFVRAPAELDEIGGLVHLKQWLKRRRHGFAESGVAFGLRPPRGVLLLGVQGAGKSLCAKAIATAWQLPLLRLDPGALYDRYVGESERRLREALVAAERMAPIVLWIDEIEKGFASAASRSADGGLSQRMFGTLLTWMQERREPVFLAATANDIEALPPELLRKGRFDEIFFVDLPSESVRREIAEIHLRRRGRDPARFDLDAIAAASEGFSGAEIEESIVAALHTAWERVGGRIDAADLASDESLSTEDILHAIQATTPISVTLGERIQELRVWAQGRCVPADDEGRTNQSHGQPSDDGALEADSGRAEAGTHAPRRPTPRRPTG